MIDYRDQQTAAMFKTAPGGYVFRVPFPLALRNPPRFLVSEEQKAQIIERLVPARPLLWGCVFAGVLTGVVIAAALAVFALSPHPNPTAVDTAAMVALSAVLIAASILVLRQWQQRRIAPIIAQLTPTDLPFTLKEAKAAAASAMSTRQMKFVLACTALAAVIVTGGGAVSVASGQTAGYFQVLSGIVFVGLTGFWARRLIARRRAELTGG